MSVAVNGHKIQHKTRLPSTVDGPGVLRIQITTLREQCSTFILAKFGRFCEA